MAPRFVDVQGGLGGDDVMLADWRRLVESLKGVVVHEGNVCLALAAVSLWHGHQNAVPSSVSHDPSLRTFVSSRSCALYLVGRTRRSHFGEALFVIE